MEKHAKAFHSRVRGTTSTLSSRHSSMALSAGISMHFAALSLTYLQLLHRTEMLFLREMREGGFSTTYTYRLLLYKHIAC